MTTINQKIQTTCKTALAYIGSQQQLNGNFLSNANRPTTFYTSLIFSTGTFFKDNPIKEKAIAFLLNEKQPNQTFNYWQKGFDEEPYPNDLDDTFVALRALHLHTPSLITEEVMADIVSLLVHQETQAGGPYHTWILNKQNDDSSDIDIVVNANIALFLSGMDIALPQLQDYFDDKILHNDLSSKYYDNQLVVLYFLSRAYTGNYTDLLVKKIFDLQNTDGHWNNPLHTAMAISSLLRLGISPVKLVSAITYLLDTEHAGSWPATPLYIERIDNGVQTYSACNAYISICCVEALTLFQEAATIQKEYVDKEKDIFLQTVLKHCLETITDPALIRQLSQSLLLLTAKDPHDEIPLLPYLFAQQLSQKTNITKDIVIDLAVANTLGWIGYTIYDKVLDGEPQTPLIPLATSSIRGMNSIFNDPLYNPGRSTIERILAGIDSATLWEHTYCKIDGMPEVFPEYGDYKVLAQKSLGHALGPILLCHIADYSHQAPIIETFFTHYLIARQLNDDAHDWKEDLENGFLNSISTAMVKKLHTLDISILQEYFWETHIDEAAALINHHVHLARMTLKKVTLLRRITFLEKLLAPLEQSANQAIAERNKTKQFLRIVDQKKYFESW